jgi:pilus assembly protein Flp/PilA
MKLARRMTANLKRIFRDTTGQGLAEYALILALIAIIAIVALLFLGSQVSDKLSVIGGTIHSVGG